MKRNQVIEFISVTSLIIVGSILLLFMSQFNVKYVFMGVLTFYGVMNLAIFLFINEQKDFSGLLIMLASIITMILLGFIDTNMALVLFVWVILLSLIKLRKLNRFYEKKKKNRLLKTSNLVLFILSGLLSVINIYYVPSSAVVILGFFCFIHGLLETFSYLSKFDK